MNIQTIAIKNIIRRKGKMALTVIGLAVGVATLVAIVTAMLGFQRSIDKKFDAFGFNIIIYPSFSNLSLSYGGMNISGVDTYSVKSLSLEDVERIKKIPSADKIAAVSPKLLEVAEVKGKRALLVGTDFNQELSVKRWWHLNGEKPGSDDEVIIGADAARELKLSVGDRFEYGGRVFKVSSILDSTGSQDDSLIFADLNQVQSIANKAGSLSLIEVSARGGGDIDTVVEDLERAIPEASVSSIKQAVQYKEKAVGSLANFGLAVSAVIIMISGLIVFTTMASSVSDRKREIGIFRAIGYRQSTVARIIFTEAFILSLIGGVTGYIAGFTPIYILPVVLKKIDLSVNLNLFVLAMAVGLAVFIGIVASLIPARRAANMDPADALKSL
ncbi:MAG: ABC transporter permease [Firmicutes bacterium]|nr:ABC transporter permease [Bacillota bacterium]